MTDDRLPRDQSPDPTLCWCCGAPTNPAELVHLGYHPEVTIYLPCAHALSKRAAQLDDQQRTGIAPRTRDQFRRIRQIVIRHGWHQNKYVGRALRRIGRSTP